MNSRAVAAAALAGLLALGATGCGQERLTVSETCAEYNAIHAVEFPADETADMLHDLEKRAAAPLKDATRLVADFFDRGGNHVAEPTDEESAADELFEGQCPRDE